jgi:hypothetical protein
MEVGVRTVPSLHCCVGDGGQDSWNWADGSFINVPVSMPNSATVSIRTESVGG